MPLPFYNSTMRFIVANALKKRGECEKTAAPGFSFQTGFDLICLHLAAASCCKIIIAVIRQRTGYIIYRETKRRFLYTAGRGKYRLAV